MKPKTEGFLYIVTASDTDGYDIPLMASRSRKPLEHMMKTWETEVENDEYWTGQWSIASRLIPLIREDG